MPARKLDKIDLERVTEEGIDKFSGCRLGGSWTIKPRGILKVEETKAEEVPKEVPEDVPEEELDADVEKVIEKTKAKRNGGRKKASSGGK